MHEYNPYSTARLDGSRPGEDPERKAGLSEQMSSGPMTDPAAGQAQGTGNPYAAPHARLTDRIASRRRGTDSEATPASRMMRLVAAIVDSAMYGVCVVLLAVDEGGGLSPVAALGLLGIVALFIVNLVLLHNDGQTLAKRWFGMRIVRTDHSRAGLGRIFGLRMLVPGLIGAIPFLGPLFSLIDALFIFGDERRCIHDHIADTVVVNV